MRPDVSIIIVSYNVAKLLRHCLDSLFERPEDGLSVEVIVVENASSDDSVAIVRQNYPKVRLIANSVNYGFPVGCNQGIRQATGRYLFFLNPDATLASDALGQLIRFLEAHPKVGIVGPQLRYADGRIQPNRRRFPSPALALVESTILQRYPPFKNLVALQRFYYEDVPPADCHEVDWLVGAAFVVRREVLEEIGGFDERYFMYSEELDFCRRAKSAGWQVWYLSQPQITHLEGQSSGQDVPRRHINFNTSKVSYFRKFYGPIVGFALRQFLRATYLFQYTEETVKLLLRHKPELRKSRQQLIRQVLASRLLPSSRPLPPLAQGIALLSAEYPPQPGGVGDYTACLADELGKTANTRVINSTAIGAWNWGSLGRVAAQLRQHPADVLNIQYQTGAYKMHPAINFLPLYLKKWRQGRNSGLTIATTFHDLRVPYLFPKAGRVREWVNQLLLKTSDIAIVTNDEDYAKALSWGANPDRLKLVPIGSNINVLPKPTETERQTIRTQYGLAPDDFGVAYFGLLNDSKGVDTLIEALAQLQAEPGWKLVIVGGETGETDPTNRDYAARLEALIKQHDLSNLVSRTSYLPPDQTSLLLHSLDAAALPFLDGASFRRGSLLAVLAHALPTITTFTTETRRHGEDAEVFKALGTKLSTKHYALGTQNSKLKTQNSKLTEGSCVMMVEPGNAGQLAKALQQVRQDDELRMRLGQNGQQLAQEFSWEGIARQWLDIFARQD